jgi:uncharacterized RDD family membrane protein YckC
MGAAYPTAGARVPYAGIATRAVALVIDVALSQAIIIVGAALLSLIASVVGELRPQWLVATLAGAAWFVVFGAYFVGFWSVTGQTPGMRIMQVRVLTAAGTPPGFWRSSVRLVGLALAIIPLFAGFLPVLVDDRRRGLPDFLARTVVVYADPEREIAAEAAAEADVEVVDAEFVPPDMSGQFG